MSSGTSSLGIRDLQFIQNYAYRTEKDSEKLQYNGGGNRSTEHFCVKPWVMDEFNRVIHEFHVWHMN